MVLLLFTSIWMSFASEKLVRKIARNGKTKSMQVETPGQAGGAACRAFTGNSSNCECDQLAAKLATSGVVSPSRIGNGTRCLPAFRAGVVTFRVFISTNLPVQVCRRSLRSNQYQAAAAANRQSGAARTKTLSPQRWCRWRKARGQVAPRSNRTRSARRQAPNYRQKSKRRGNVTAPS